MGVRILVGDAGGSTHAAAMYCSTSGWMIGPLFEAEDAEEQVQAFCDWITEGRALSLITDLRLEPPLLGSDGRDPRNWGDRSLEKLVQRWRDDHVENDLLLDPFSCACGDGHHHLGEHGETARYGECCSCPCTEWAPGNRAAAAAQKED